MPQAIRTDLKFRQILTLLQPFCNFNSQVFFDFIFQPYLSYESLQLLFDFFLSQHIQFKLYKEMQSKWKVFFITFFSFALIHGTRTSWSSLKYTMNSPPYSFSPVFLGTLDMLVLIILAISLNLFGPKVVSGGPKQYLLKGMIGLSIVVIVLGLLLFFTVESQVPYAIVYPIVGIFSCVGWPACIYILSLHFQKGIAFSLWNGCIQFGDFTAILLSFVFVQAAEINPGIFLFTIAGVLFGIGLLTKALISEVQTRQTEPLPESSPADKYVQDDLTDQKDIPSNDQMSQVSAAIRPKKKVNFLTVWTLPGVSGYILSFVFVKTVYAMISTWLVFYLHMLSMVSEAHIIALLWSASTFGGGILGIYINKKFKKKYFIISLFVAALFFIFLEEMHLYPNELEIIVLILGCGVAFGGPYTIMNTSIPLFLSQKPAIKEHPGAKAAIISAMEGYSLLFCGITLIFVPSVGVFDLHWVACIYCVISALILSRQSYLEYEQRVNSQEKKRHASQPVIKGLKEKEYELSANLEGAKSGKKRRKTRRPSVKSLQSQEKSSKDEKKSKESSQNYPESKSSHSEKVAKESLPSQPSNEIKDELERDNKSSNENKIDSEEKFFEKQQIIELQQPYRQSDENQFEYQQMNEVQVQQCISQK